MDITELKKHLEMLMEANSISSIKHGNLLINFTRTYDVIWKEFGLGCKRHVAFWEPLPDSPASAGYFPLGDLANTEGINVRNQRLVALVQEGDPDSEETRLKGKALSPPVNYEALWSDSSSNRTKNKCTLWRPIPAPGYVALGMVCEPGTDKPSKDRMRCVRTDLVIACDVGDQVWNDGGSGLKTDFSAWSIKPPAATPGEVYFSAGTFIGAASYTKPARHGVAYALRLKIPPKINPPPPAPVLQGYAAPSRLEVDTVSYTCDMAWFSVKDPDLSPIQQWQTSPLYTLERTDRYVLVGFGHNQTSATQTFKWAVIHGVHGSQARTFTAHTAVDIGAEWHIGVPTSPIKVSAKLSQSLSRTQTSTSGWTKTTNFEVTATVPSTKAIAAYLVQSNYRLLRKDGTQLSSTVSYTDVNSVYWSEYPPAKECTVDCQAQAARDSAP